MIFFDQFGLCAILFCHYIYPPHMSTYMFVVLRFINEMLLCFLHLIVILIVAIQNVNCHFRHKICYPKHEMTRNDVSVIMEHLPKLNKQLNHLIVLADTEHQYVSDLARIVIWSLVAKVPYVSFYDVTGDLEKNKETLYQEIERHKKGIPGYVKWPTRMDCNGHTNGTQAHSVTIHIFDSRDGRPKITQCISQIAEERRSMQNCEAVSVQELGTRLFSLYPSIPDPDVVFYTGRSLRTNGLLPWQIRLTEFVQLSRDHYVNVNSYISALYRYNERNQRFGQ